MPSHTSLAKKYVNIGRRISNLVSKFRIDKRQSAYQLPFALHQFRIVHWTVSHIIIFVSIGQVYIVCSLYKLLSR